MARLVGVCSDPSNGSFFKNKQLPLCVEDMMTMVVEFADPCEGSSADSDNAAIMTPRQFCQKLSSFNSEEVDSALSVNSDQFYSQLSQLVPCVGCRKSVEKLYGEISRTGYSAIDPMVVSKRGLLSIKPAVMQDAKKLYKLIMANSGLMRDLLDELTKCRRNKRCILHSLDAHQYKTKADWSDLWSMMSKDCRNQCCTVQFAELSTTLDSYLLKHRFCVECKNKVTRAYQLLIGEALAEGEKHYNASLYNGIQKCSNEAHLHIKSCPHFLNALIERAEPELSGNMRERHAKTLDIAQGEVLTCLGLHMYERLHRVVTAIRNLHQTFQILYCTSIVTLFNKFQVTYEGKHGLSASLEMLCEELQHCTLPNRRTPKKNKRKNRSTAPKKSVKGQSPAHHQSIPDAGVVLEPGGMTQEEGSKSGLDAHLSSSSPPRSSSPADSHKSKCSSDFERSPSRTIDLECKFVHVKRQMEHIKVHEAGGDSARHEPDFAMANIEDSNEPDLTSSPQIPAKSLFQYFTACDKHGLSSTGCDCGDSGLSLDDGGSSEAGDRASGDTEEGGDGGIPQEDIAWFQANQNRVCAERAALRERLLIQFQNMQCRLTAGGNLAPPHK